MGEVCNMYQQARKRKRTRSSDSKSSSSSEAKSKARKRAHKGATCVKEVSDSEATTTNSEFEKSKQEALNKVIRLRDSGLDVEETRRQWRTILREYHPDKHADKEL